MVGLDVELKVVNEIVLVQKCQGGLGVVIVLVFGRFSRFGFDKKLCRVAHALFIVYRHFIHCSHIVAFFFEIGVQEGLLSIDFVN